MRPQAVIKVLGVAAHARKPNSTKRDEEGKDAQASNALVVPHVGQRAV